MDATQVKGRTLDIILTNFRALMSEVKVHIKSESICKSGHYPISFKVSASVKNKNC